MSALEKPQVIVNLKFYSILKNDGCFRLLNEKVMDENKKKSPKSSM